MSFRRPTATRTKALELLASGLSEREVQARLTADGHKVSKGSIGNWKAAGAGKGRPGSAPAPKSAASSAPVKKQKAGKATTPDPTSRASSAGAWTAPAGLDDLVPAGTDLTNLPSELLEVLGRHLTKRVIDETNSEIPDDHVVGELFKFHGLVIKALVMARPPVALDPENDPGNLEMAAIAIHHIKRMIADKRKTRAAPVTTAPTPTEAAP